jgi:hypothetical protein
VSESHRRPAATWLACGVVPAVMLHRTNPSQGGQGVGGEATLVEFGNQTGTMTVRLRG